MAWNQAVNKPCTKCTVSKNVLLLPKKTIDSLFSLFSIASKINPITLYENVRRSSRAARKVVSYLTRVKVKVVRIERRVKIKYLLLTRSCLSQGGLSSAGEGASSQAGPLSHRSGNDVSVGWEFADCFYIWEIPEDRRSKDLWNVVPKVTTVAPPNWTP